MSAADDRRARFVEEYIIDLNGAAAAARAGYAKGRANVTACELLQREDVQAAVAAKQAEISIKLGVTAERVIAEMAKLGFSNMLDYVRVNDDGLPYTDFSALTRDQAAALTEVTVETRKERRGGAEKTSDTIEKVRFKLADKRSALADLGKHLGLFKEHVELTAKVDVTEDKMEICRRMAFLFASAKPKTEPSGA